jgi:putative ABC transport system permease protein
VTPKYRLLGAGSARLMWRARLRSGLVVACASLGVAGVITSVDYAAGGRQQVLDQVRRMGVNAISITAEQSSVVAGRARTGSIVTTLREADYTALRREVPGRVRSSAIITQPFRIKAGDFSKTASIVGCEPAFFAIKSWRPREGTLFDGADLRRSARVAVLGQTVATDLFGTDAPIGERIFVNRVPFDVIGVLAERGQGLDLVNEDDQVYVPLTTAMRRILNVDYFSSMLFEIDDWRDMDAAAAAIAGVMHDRHRARAGQRDDFQVQNQKALVDTQIATSARLGYFVRWIGVSGLVVSGLGVLAIAWIGVRDRTREIGTRRALGATAGDVFFQFVFEASVLASAGGVSGVGLGRAASRVVAERAGLPPVFDGTAAASALATALALNLVFAAWPALRAAKLDPIAALRHE